MTDTAGLIGFVSLISIGFILIVGIPCFQIWVYDQRSKITNDITLDVVELEVSELDSPIDSTKISALNAQIEEKMEILAKFDKKYSKFGF